MRRLFTLSEANEILPEAVRRVTQVVAARDQLVQIMREAAQVARSNGERGPASEAETALRDELAWFDENGIQLKGLDPPLLDFPAAAGEREILLCWQEGEDHIEWYHELDTGFAGRTSIADLGW